MLSKAGLAEKWHNAYKSYKVEVPTSARFAYALPERHTETEGGVMIELTEAVIGVLAGAE